MVYARAGGLYRTTYKKRCSTGMQTDEWANCKPWAKRPTFNRRPDSRARRPSTVVNSNACAWNKSRLHCACTTRQIHCSSSLFQGWLRSSRRSLATAVSQHPVSGRSCTLYNTVIIQYTPQCSIPATVFIGLPRKNCTRIAHVKFLTRWEKPGLLSFTACFTTVYIPLNWLSQVNSA